MLLGHAAMRARRIGGRSTILGLAFGETSTRGQGEGEGEGEGRGIRGNTHPSPQIPWCVASRFSLTARWTVAAPTQASRPGI